MAFQRENEPLVDDGFIQALLMGGGSNSPAFPDPTAAGLFPSAPAEGGVQPFDPAPDDGSQGTEGRTETTARELAGPDATPQRPTGQRPSEPAPVSLRQPSTVAAGQMPGSSSTSPFAPLPPSASPQALTTPGYARRTPMLAGGLLGGGLGIMSHDPGKPEPSPLLRLLLSMNPNLANILR